MKVVRAFRAVNGANSRLAENKPDFEIAEQDFFRLSKYVFNITTIRFFQ
jgi:hypothetical protein